jgi:hypothetical protein
MNTKSKMTAKQNKSLIVGLKTQVVRQGNLKREAEKDVDLHQQFILKLWREGIPVRTLETSIWDYVESSGGIWYKGKMEKYKSIIAPYTNQKGDVSQAHYTIHNKYLGSVKKLGEKPISYVGYFEVNKDEFDIDMDMVLNEENHLIAKCFKEKISINTVVYGDKIVIFKKKKIVSIA